MWTVLSVAYPLARVRPETAGGAEQVLAMLDEALVRAGHHSIVIAPEGSTVAGTLVPTPEPPQRLDEAAIQAARRQQRAAIRKALARWPVSLVHMHGQDFEHCLPPAGVPVLVTLHVPRDWYGPLRIARPETWLHCVSEAQRRTWPDDLPMLPVIENGIPVERYTCGKRKRGFALALGRVAPEKGFHIALEAAEAAGVPLVLAGQVYHYEAHDRYFLHEIAPRLAAGHARFIGPVGFERKRRLLAGARCLLAPSQAPETSSLVAMEGLASGTPVIAYPAGALADIVENGKTGYLVRTPGEMALAIRAAEEIDPGVCCRTARERFHVRHTIAEYFEVYRKLIRH